MHKYIFKRVLMMIPVLLGISFVIYALMSISPGDPARMILGENADLAAVEALRDEMGLNDPFLIQYGRHMLNMLKGDLGTSWIFNIPVFDQIIARMPSTVALAIGSTFVMLLLGLPTGIISAVKKYTWVDSVTLMISLLLTSMPVFWLGLMMQLVFSLNLHLLPAQGVDTLKHYILPCVTLGAGMMANLIRMTRSSVLEVTKQDYIRTARAKGCKEGIVVRRHILRNAMLPVITIVGLQFGSLLGGTMIIESVFAMPGLGSLVIQAVRQKDTPLVVAAVMFVAFMGGIINLIVDILYAYVDPRIKSQYVKKA